jgi:hypothetical protein
MPYYPNIILRIEYFSNVHILILVESVTLGLSPPLAEMSIGKRKIMFLGSRERPVRKADNLTAICEPIV